MGKSLFECIITAEIGRREKTFLYFWPYLYYKIYLHKLACSIYKKWKHACRRYVKKVV
jgi:hypothetical protein